MLILLVPLAILITLIFALWSSRYILRHEAGTPSMREISQAIQVASRAFIKRQYSTITVIALIVGVILYVVFDRFLRHDYMPIIGLGFIFGAVCSLCSGIIGLEIATRSNVRTTYATKKGLPRALRLAFLGGAIIGLCVIALSLFGVTLLFYLFNKNPHLIIGFGFGASFSALFAQLGGGIYTKGADVGADLVGKVEAGIPEDDPRNAAVIADLVGDQVGDCAGREADLFESCTAENIGAMIVGLALYEYTRNFNFIFFPLVARAVGIIATLFGAGFVIATEKNRNPMAPLRNGLVATTLFCVVAFYFLVQAMLGDVTLYYAALAGLAACIAIQFITEYYTGRAHRPVQEIAKASRTGAATNILTGFAMGLECTALPVLALAAALMASYWFGGLYGASAGIGFHAGGVYGTAVATMAMLSVAGMVLALDGYGPIVDNAGGIAEMSNAEEEIRAQIDALDATGNTTKALTKGYAMGSAALAAILLFQAYLETVRVNIVDIVKPLNLLGLFLGVLLPFIFSAFAIRAVGVTAFHVVEEVRRQFKTIPGLMEGKAKPDYAKAVDICTREALKQMITPTLLIVISLIAVGFMFGAAAAGAFIMGATFTGIVLAMLMNTGGAAWDNAKKFIEDGRYGGKGSPTHAASVIGDTVGDPLKDCSGPSLHVLIKLLNMVSILFGPFFIYGILHL
jgi:K(+)-stimulated pyrophosphate-energized sodium pump